MPKLPRISGAETVRALERLGFIVCRQKGSHIILRRGSTGCVVPNHREIKVGTLSGVLKQAEVSAEEFLEALRKKT
jgi:predicted RNA binding protein YcfA (HicA-like mRNA interferase family)